MLAKRYFLVCAMLAICHPGLGQKKLPPIKWLLKQAVGPNSSLTSFPKSYPTNYLVSQYAKASVTVQLVSVQRYFGNWGAEVNLAVKSSSDDAYAGLQNAITKKYQSDKFEFTRQQTSTDFVYSAGPVYKKEFGRFVFIGKALAGVTSNKADSAFAVVKESATHSLHNVNWNPSYSFSYHAVFNPGVAVMYRINRAFAVSVEVSYWQMSNHLTFTERTTDASDDRLITQKEYQYSTPVRQVNFGIGLNFTP